MSSVIDLSEGASASPETVRPPPAPASSGIELAPAVWPAETRCDEIFRGLHAGTAPAKKKQA